MTLVVPSLQEELNRKVLNSLSGLVDGYAKGKLTKEHLSVGADVLFEAVSGLVERDFIKMITEIGDMTKDVQKTERSVLQMKKTIVILTRQLDTPKIDLLKIVDGVSDAKQYSYDSNSEASRRYQGMLQTMTNNGWKIL